jgi:uncharacterized protein (TIGR00296 family)
MDLSIEDGRRAVGIAREALETRFSDSPSSSGAAEDSTIFGDKRGVFVTLNRADTVGERLRGCVGFPYPVRPLGDAIRSAAIAAATEDPRFPPVTESELGSLVVEVSILTPPKDVSAPRRQDLPSMIRIGTDGLIIEDELHSGLLLPQVASEFGMSQMEFLSQTCMKAGLPPDSWLDEHTRVLAFQAEIFSEMRPRGEVRRVTSSDS